MGAAAAAGAGLQIAQGVYGEVSNRHNQKEAQKQADRNRKMLQGGMQTGPSPYEEMLSQFLGQQSASPAYNAQQINASQFGQPTQSASFNAGQDALMQMVRADPMTQLGQAGTTLANLAATGGAQNAQALVDQLRPMQQMQMGDQVAGLNAKVSGLGQRMGSANRLGEARLRSDLGAQQNAQNAGIYQQTFESGQNRMMGAAGQLGSLLQAAQGLRQNAAQGLGQYAQIGQAGNSQLLQALMANQGAGLQANAQNQNALQSYQQMMLAGLGQNQSAYGQRMGQNNQLLAQMAGGQYMPGATQSPLLEGAQTAMFMPYLLRQMQGMGGGGMGGTQVGSTAGRA